MTSQRYWTALPPFPLRGVGTPLVESLSTYIIRIGENCGLPLTTFRRHISRMIGRSASLAPDEPAFDESVHALEKLTGVENLVAGSFRWIRDVIEQKSLTSRRHERRWCPVCYLRWSEDSWEPLIWSLDLIQRCTEHGCTLESACHACHAPQSLSTPYARRRTCAKCHQVLGHNAPIVALSQYQEWVERQVLDVITLCSTPSQPALPQDTIYKYVVGLEVTARAMPSPPLRVKELISLRKIGLQRFKRVRLRVLINLCSLQAVPLRQVLMDPCGSASAPLLDLWESFSFLPMSFGPQFVKAHAFEFVLRKLLRRLEGHCLPAMTEVLHFVELTCEQAKDLKPEIYLRYQAAYAKQAGPNQQTPARRALRVAIRLLTDNETLGTRGHHRKLDYVGTIALNARVPLELARKGLATAKEVRRILREAQLLMTRCNPPALENSGWTKGFGKHRSPSD